MIANVYIPVNNEYFQLMASILNSDGSDTTISDLDKHAENGRMFILKLNINPQIEEPDAEDELRWWIGESNKILSDNTLDMKTKLEMLMPIDIKFDDKYILNGVKIIENNSDKKVIYNISVLINKLDYEQK